MAEFPEFHHLILFARVVEARSISGGARAAGLAQSTVSEHLAALEKGLGTRLFDRVNGEIRPTDAGKMLYRHALDLLKRRQAALDEIRGLQGLSVGSLDVGGSNIPGVYLLPALIAAFQRAHPGVQLQLRVGDSQQIADAVAEGAIDVAVIGNEPPKGTLRARAVGRDRLVPIVPRGHAWAGKRKLALRALTSEPFLARERGSGTRAAIERGLLEGGVDVGALRVAAELGSNEAVKQSVLAGLGFSIVSERSVRREIEAGTLVRVPLDGVRLERPFYLVTDSRRSASPLRRAFEEHVIAAVKA